MKTFDQVMQFTRTVSSHTAFEDPECRAYFDLLSSLDPLSAVVEIGLQFGRSSSIALQVAKDRRLCYWGVDPFVDPPEALDVWAKMRDIFVSENFWPALFVGKSEDAEEFLPRNISLALVDGDHWETGVRKDCALLMPRIKPGGYLLFHDYGRDSLPDVYPTVNATMIESIMGGRHWEELPTVGTLGIWRRK